MKLDLIAVLNNNTPIRYFWDRLKPVISAKLDRSSHYLNNWKKVIKKAIDIKYKATLPPALFAKNMNCQCARGHRPLKANDFDKNVEPK